MIKFVCIAIAICAGMILSAQETIKLPPPDKTGGKPLMQCLNARQSTREFSEKELTPQQLSDLLWAAFGINRADGKRTAPTAHDRREFDIYVAMKSGVYLYMAKENELKGVVDKDVRANCGNQEFHAVVPVDLIYVADQDRMSGSPADRNFYAATDCGFISQNVYLYCASEGLATVVCGWIDRQKISSILGLKNSQKVILTQPVGYPK